MDHSAARARLDTMIEECDRAVLVLQGEGAHESSELSTLSQHPADHASEISEADREDALVEAMSLRKVEALGALARLDDGSYGACLECGLPIPEERLAVLPEASRCAEHESLRRQGR